MSLTALYLQARKLGLRRITWRYEPDMGWFCFAENVPVPHTAMGRTGRDALAELIRFFKAIR